MPFIMHLFISGVSVMVAYGIYFWGGSTGGRFSIAHTKILCVICSKFSKISYQPLLKYKKILNSLCLYIIELLLYVHNSNGPED